MSVLILIALVWAALAAIVLVAMATLGRAGRRADGVSEQAAAELLARREAAGNLPENVTPIGPTPAADAEPPAAAAGG